MAVAREQEMKALAQEMKAKVIEAEANVPLAMSEAFRSIFRYRKYRGRIDPRREQYRNGWMARGAILASTG